MFLLSDVIDKNLLGLQRISADFTYHSIFQFSILLGFGVKFQAQQGKKALPSLKLEGVLFIWKGATVVFVKNFQFSILQLNKVRVLLAWPKRTKSPRLDFFLNASSVTKKLNSLKLAPLKQQSVFYAFWQLTTLKEICRIQEGCRRE